MTLAIEWAEKYRPQTLKDIVGEQEGSAGFTNLGLRNGFQALPREGQ